MIEEPGTGPSAEIDIEIDLAGERRMELSDSNDPEANALHFWAMAGQSKWGYSSAGIGRCIDCLLSNAKG